MAIDLVLTAPVPKRLLGDPEALRELPARAPGTQQLDRLTAELRRIRGAGLGHGGHHPFAAKRRKHSGVHETGSTPIVVLTPPFAGSLLVSVRVLRLLRLVRLLRLATLARAVFSLAGVRYAALVAALTAVAGAQAFSTVENVSAGDALYWSLMTMTTVGYGDVTPKTDTGRAIAVAVMLVGIGFVAILTGAIAQRFIAPAEESLAMGEQELRDRLDRIAARLDQLETASRDRAV
jgi:voltage-gated potassium channel Kch